MFPKSRLIPYLGALLTSAAVLVAVVFLDRGEQTRFRQEARARVLNHLGVVRARLESALNSRVFLVRGLVAYVSNHPDITDAEFRTFAAALSKQQTGIRSIQLARNTVISNVYPLEGNEKAMGLRLLELPEQREAVERAIRSGRTVVAGPVDLVQGGVAFISRTPIFATRVGGSPERSHYWGLATVVIDKDVVFEEAGLNRDAAFFSYALRGKDSLGGRGEVFLGDDAVFAADPVKLDVTLPNGTWQIAAVPKGGWITPHTGWLWPGGGLLATVAGFLVWFLLRNPARLAERVEQTTRALRESERDLRKSEAQFRSLLENAVDFVVYRLEVDPVLPFGARVLLVSPSARDILGIPDPYDLESWFAYVHPEDLNRVTEANRRAVTFGETYSQTLRCHHPEKQAWRWISTIASPIFDAEGRLTHFNGLITDITQQKQAEEFLQRAKEELETKVAIRTIDLKNANEQLRFEILERERAEEALREQMALYQALLKAQSDVGEGVCIIEDGRLIYGNEALCALSGYTSEEILAFPSFSVLVHPSDRARVEENHRRRVAGEQFENRYEIALLTRAGGRRDAEIAVATMPMNGKLRTMVVIIDITARKQAEETVRKLSVAVEHSANSVIITDPEGRIEYVNPKFQKMTGYSRDEVLGHTPRILKSGRTPEETYPQLWATITAGGEWHGEFCNRHKDGSHYWVSASISPSFDRDGKITHFLGIQEDITARKDMENALVAQLNFIQALIDAIPNPLFFKDKRGAYLGCNTAFEAALGISREEIVGKTVYDLAPRELAEKYREMDDALFAAPGFQVYESKVKFANGSRRDIIFSKATFAGTGGEVDGLVGVMLDITERKAMEEALRRARDELEIRVRERTRELVRINDELIAEIAERQRIEKALRESEELFRLLVQQAADAFFLMDLKGRLVDVNQLACRSLGYTREELLALQVWEIEAAYSEAELKHLWHAMPVGQAGTFHGVHRRKDGSTFPVEVRGIKIEIGGKLRILGLARDVTERKLAEETLKRQAQIIHQIHDSVIATDLHGNVTFWNMGAERMFGYTAQEATGKHISFLYVDPWRRDLHQEVIAHLRTKGVYETETQRRRKTGEVIFVHLVLSLLKDRSGEIIGMVGYSMDITERKHLEKEIIEVSEEEQKRIGQELHDGLGQHLTGIAFLSKVLEQKLSTRSLPESVDASEIVKFVNQAVSKTRHLARGLYPVELEANGLMSALEQLAANTKTLFGIECLFQCAAPVLVHDNIAAINLYRIAQEAVNNAVKHSKAKNIRIELSSQSGKIALTVADDGIGFDAARVEEGKGMGLHIMGHRARMIGGTLQIRTTLRGGTIISVS